MDGQKKTIKKIFIAGAYGMVGSAIRRAYLQNLDKLNYEAKLLTPKRDELDLTNYEKLNYWFLTYKPDFVIIAAAKVGGILANCKHPYEFILNNLKIQTNLIEISFNHKVKKLLFLGSSCIYPKFSQQPIDEEYLLSGPLEETNEFYAISKISGIKLCQSLNLQYGFNSICLMPSNLYGPGDNYNALNSHVLPALIKKFTEAKEKELNSVTCWGTGKVLREFLYVDDLAEACIFAIDNWDPKAKDAPKDKNNKPLLWLNVGSSDEISIENLAKKIAKLVGFNGDILWDNSKPDGTPRKKLNTMRMKNLGWESTTSLDAGIIKTINYYKKDFKNNNLRK